MTKLSIEERTTVEARIWQMQTCDGRLRQMDHIEFLQETSLTHLLISGQFSLSLERILIWCSCDTKAEIFELSWATAD